VTKVWGSKGMTLSMRRPQAEGGAAAVRLLLRGGRHLELRAATPSRPARIGAPRRK